MGISFRISKIGRRCVPPPVRTISGESENPDEAPSVSNPQQKQQPDPRPAVSYNHKGVSHTGNHVHGVAVLPASLSEISPEYEVSFVITLYDQGYSIGKQTEMHIPELPVHDEKTLHPYDKASETLFSAIESGRLPADILNNIPCKYYDGVVICEVHDYRKGSLEQGYTVPIDTGVPVVHKVKLQMTMDNVIKDIALMCDDSWTYRDLMEVEARIIKALQPQLHLDPKPDIERLCQDPVPKRLNLNAGIKRRLPQHSETVVTSNMMSYGKKVCIDRMPETTMNSLHDSMMGNASHHIDIVLKNMSRGTQGFTGNSVSPEVARAALSSRSPSNIQSTGNYTNISLPQNYGSSFNNIGNTTSPLVKREIQDVQQSDITKMKQASDISDMSTQQMRTQGVGFGSQEMQWKSQHVQQIDGKGAQYPTLQRYPPARNNLHGQDAAASFYFTQQGMRFGAKEEPVDPQRLEGRQPDKPKDSLQPIIPGTGLDQQQSHPQQMQQQFVRNISPNIMQWQNARPSVEKDMRRKAAQNPRFGSGSMIQSPVSSKSGEFSSSQAAATLFPGTQSDISGVTTATPASGGSSGGKRKSCSVTKTQTTTGAGLQANNLMAPMNSNSSMPCSTVLADQLLLERFGKIESLTKRYQLNSKKNKVDSCRKTKPAANAAEQVAFCLAQSFTAEDFMDPTQPMSRSLLGGTTNTCKSRTMSFLRNDHQYQALPLKPHCRLILKEKQLDGVVGMYYGDIEDSDMSALDCMITLPTKHYADSLAAQLTLLMEREGYQKTEDEIRPLPVASVSSLHTLAGSYFEGSAPEVKQEAASNNLSNLALQSNSPMAPLTALQNLANPRLLTSANNNQALAMSQGFLPDVVTPGRTQQTADQVLLQQQLHQHQHQQQQQWVQQNSQSQQQTQQLSLSQMQRPAPLLSTNPLSHMIGPGSSNPMAMNHLANSKPTALQLQLMQHQQQQAQHQQQSSQIPRKVLMGLNSPVGLGSISNSVVGLNTLGNNVVNMTNLRGLSSPVGPMPSLSSVSTNQINHGAASSLVAGVRSGSLSPHHAAAFAKLRLAQQRAGMYGHSTISGISGSSTQTFTNSAGMSMMGHPLRANISTVQRTTLPPMGPPKIPGANFYLSPQQQLQFPQQTQHMQQMHQKQQQVNSPLQQQQGQVDSPAMQHQQMNSQQMGQHIPMSPQLSTGALQQQQVNNGNNVCAGVGPASPQLSSQTHGSVSSITSSPMDHQHQGAK